MQSLLTDMRGKLGLTQAQVAAKMGVAQGSYSRVEGARWETWRLGTLEEIARAMGGELIVEIIFKKANPTAQKELSHGESSKLLPEFERDQTASASEDKTHDFMKDCEK